MMSGLRTIELIGMPGSGKTTVSHLLCRELETLGIVPLTLPEAGRVVARRSWLGAVLSPPGTTWGDRFAWKIFGLERLMRGVGFLVIRPRLAWLLIMSQLRRPRSARGRQRRVMSWWIRIAGARSVLLARRNDDEVVVLDEGFCHRVVQLFSSADEVPDHTMIARYASYIPFPDVLMHVAASVDLSYSRIVDRGIWERLEREDPVRVKAFLASADLAISHLLDSGEARAARVIEVNNTSEPPSGSEIQGRLRSVGALA